MFEGSVAKEMYKRVEDVLRQLFNEYSLSAANNASSTQGVTCPSNAGESSTKTDVTKAFRFTDKNLESASELDIYLMELRT
ncbi:hypothetical protein E5676_scaffold257G00340 [Cucumis melo var. makuwa]|uniref:Uncharacterized protein n=1 Tax=Cucumis melo var. makuwa TaxID=1194695 RepID=A0A5A7UUK9_CUCMM|nr:hypothetical protein E6C27_scaffold280G00640 [Cucumis melo var. makuwa]TYK18733.1 hypothetical protein E5676_scaffold257G00340 [Cucumis melo var. makuwa]